MKKLFPLFMAIFLLFVGTVPEIAFAEDETKATESNTISGNLFEKSKQEDFENNHYEIDTAPHKDDEKGFFSKAWGYMFGDDSVGKDIQRKINGVGQWIVALMFQFGVWLTKILLFIVEQSFSLDIIDAIADKLGQAMQNIAGIGSKPEFESEGLFPAIIKMTCIFSVLYFLYLFFVKRQMTKGISELLKVVCVIAGILVYVANAPAILKGMNTISSEISLQVLSKSTGTIQGNPGQSKDTAITNVKRQMWDLMVDRPYLYLQYGQDSADSIGKERINQLLGTPPGEDRTKMVSEDVEKNKNFMMTNDSVGERLIFTFMYYIVNTFAGVPTAVICLLIVACQLLFMVMSIIGPIAMAFALLPKNRRVLISWAEQWLKPLAAKIFLSLIVIILFSIAGLLYDLPEAGTSGYIMTMILQILVFVLCYIFRDNIKAAFRKSKVAYNSFTDLEYMAGRTKDGFNRTMDGINTGLGKAKDMFGDSSPDDMGDDPSEHTADDNGAKQATVDEEKTAGSEEEAEKPQYASIGNEADEDKKVSLEKESNAEGQSQDEARHGEEEQERTTMDDDEVIVTTEQEETEEYQEDQEEVNPDNLASLEGVDEDEEQNPELAEVEDVKQPEQDDSSEYENQEDEGNNEELKEIGENEEGTEQGNPELAEVEDVKQPEQDDPSDYENQEEEGDTEELKRIGENEEGTKQGNPELSDVEDVEQPEQDDPSDYENQEEEGDTEELKEIGESEEEAKQENPELSDVDNPEQVEQDDPSDYETENQEENNEELATMDGNNEEAKQESPELSDVDNPEQVEQDDPSDYETENQEENNEDLATMDGNNEEAKQENPELSDVDNPEQVEQDDSSDYETENQEENNEDLATMDGNNEEVEQENPELSDVEDVEQPEQDDSSDYETEHEEGNGEELATTEGAETDSPQDNPELSDVEAPEQVEQDDSSRYEAEHEEGSETKLATTGGSAGDSPQERAEVSEIETPGQPEQDNTSEYETKNSERSSSEFANVGELKGSKGTSNAIEMPTEKTGHDVPPLDETQKPFHSSSVEQVSEGENEFMVGESSDKELTSTKGLEIGSSGGMGTSNVEGSPIGNNSTKASSLNQFDVANPSGNGAITESMNVGPIQDASIESSGDLTKTSPDSLVSSGTIPNQSMSGNSLGGQKVTGQSVVDSQEIRGQDSSQILARAMEAKQQGNTESSQNSTNGTPHIESAQAEVAASEEMMIDATQERTELETVVVEDETETK
ncbi:hypothetical protein J7E43_05695 [Bacillus sp. ISL-8]|nr:hypothetical protein [Bacillus sp. ISL-8]